MRTRFVWPFLWISFDKNQIARMEWNGIYFINRFILFSFHFKLIWKHFYYSSSPHRDSRMYVFHIFNCERNWWLATGAGPEAVPNLIMDRFMTEINVYSFARRQLACKTIERNIIHPNALPHYMQMSFREMRCDNRALSLGIQEFIWSSKYIHPLCVIIRRNIKLLIALCVSITPALSETIWSQ